MRLSKSLCCVVFSICLGAPESSHAFELDRSTPESTFESCDYIKFLSPEINLEAFRECYTLRGRKDVFELFIGLASFFAFLDSFPSREIPDKSSLSAKLESFALSSGYADIEGLESSLRTMDEDKLDLLTQGLLKVFITEEPQADDIPGFRLSGVDYSKGYATAELLAGEDAEHQITFKRNHGGWQIDRVIDIAEEGE